MGGFGNWERHVEGQRTGASNTGNSYLAHANRLREQSTEAIRSRADFLNAQTSLSVAKVDEYRARHTKGEIALARAQDYEKIVQAKKLTLELKENDPDEIRRREKKERRTEAIKNASATSGKILSTIAQGFKGLFGNRKSKAREVQDSFPDVEIDENPRSSSVAKNSYGPDVEALANQMMRDEASSTAANARTPRTEED